MPPKLTLPAPPNPTNPLGGFVCAGGEGVLLAAAGGGVGPEVGFALKLKGVVPNTGLGLEIAGDPKAILAGGPNAGVGTFGWPPNIVDGVALGPEPPKNEGAGLG